MLLHFHGDFQDGVLRPLINIIEKNNRSTNFLKWLFSIFILNVAIIVLFILIHQINDFLKCMFELFHDTFTYGYNFKVNVKFKVKYLKK